MDYIGSKLKLNNWIFEIINKHIDHPEKMFFLDACSGSGSVSKYAIKAGYQVISNDLMKFSSTIINGSVGLTKTQYNTALEKINKFNSINQGIDGYFYTNFCDESSPPRFYFTAKNARLIDLIRKEIDFTNDLKIRDYLLYCGLEAISRVSNTAGVQAAFLKKYKDRAKNTFKLVNENITEGSVSVFNRDILSLLKDKEFRTKYQEDILYIDPPYNQRQYGPNYHLYETFVRNDNPQTKGLTGLRNWKNESYSNFCVKKNCLQFLKSIIDNSTAKLIFISYNSDGILHEKEIKTNFPTVKIHERDQRRFKSDTSETRTYNDKKLIEYLFEIQKK